MIAGLEDITSGELKIGGERMNEKGPRERNLAMVLQNYALYPHLSVYENIAFPLGLQKRNDTEIRKKVEESAATPGAHRAPSASSASSRGASASGWPWAGPSSGRPRPSSSTSPLSNLEAKLRGQMRTEISRLQRRLGITVYVTHDQTEAMTLGDRVVALRKGLLQQVASPRELYERPVNLFVAGFIAPRP